VRVDRGLRTAGSSVLAFYLLFGVCQEYLVKIQHDDDMGWYITFTQFSYYTSFALAQRRLACPDTAWQRTVPWSYYVILGGLQAMSVGLSNVSVQYLTYPTHILFKSSKPIPGLLYGAVFLRRRYIAADWLGVAMMAAGLLFIAAADLRSATALEESADDDEDVQQSDTLGLILVSAAIFSEVLIGSVQEKVLSKLKATQDELIFYTHLVSCVAPSRMCLPVCIRHVCIYGMFVRIVCVCVCVCVCMYVPSLSHASAHTLVGHRGIGRSERGDLISSHLISSHLISSYLI
jgi:drug/metabolite transporter (DMT)-like permease